MLRLARIDAPDVLHHIMIRGIKPCNIFLNNTCRRFFWPPFETASRDENGLLCIGIPPSSSPSSFPNWTCLPSLLLIKPRVVFFLTHDLYYAYSAIAVHASNEGLIDAAEDYFAKLLEEKLGEVYAAPSSIAILSTQKGPHTRSDTTSKSPYSPIVTWSLRRQVHTRAWSGQETIHEYAFPQPQDALTWPPKGSQHSFGGGASIISRFLDLSSRNPGKKALYDYLLRQDRFRFFPHLRFIGGGE